MSEQADLRLVNLIGRGYTMAEARKKLNLDKPKPEATKPLAPEGKKAPVPEAAPADDNALL